MSPAIQDTLLELFEQVHLNPESLPAIPIDEWGQGSTERKLLESFRAMAEHVQERMNQLRQTEEQLFEREEQYCSMHVVNALVALNSSGVYQTITQSLHKDGTAFYIEGRGMAFTYKGKPHTLSVIRDVTEQVQAQQLLEQRVEERTRELATLLEISHTVASTLQLKPLLGLILDQLKTVVDYKGSAITIIDDQDLVMIATRGANYTTRFHRHFMVSLWVYIQPACNLIATRKTLLSRSTTCLSYQRQH